MDQRRKARQKRKKMAWRWAENNAALVNQLKEGVRVCHVGKAPPSSFAKPVKKHAGSRKKRQHNEPHRFKTGGVVFVSEGLQIGLAKDYPQRGGIWSSSLKRWAFMPKENS